MILKELLALLEAKKKPAVKKPTFKKYTNFNSWNDDNGASYFETEVDGKLIGALRGQGGVIGVWYNRAGVGSISNDFMAYAKAHDFYTDLEDLAGEYAELDPNWPYN